MSGGIIQVVDPATRDTVYRDVATGEEISRTPAVPGTPTQASGPPQGSTTTSDGPQSPRVIPGYNAPSVPYATGGAPQGSAVGGQGPDPSKRLFPGSETIAGPNGTFVYHYTDGSFSQPFQKGADPNALQQAELAKTQAETNRILAGGQSASAGASIINNQNTIAQQQAALAQSRAQYQQTAQAQAAAQKAQSEFQQAQLAQQLQIANQTNATNQGNTLLGLGSRPETLIRYLYALRGQQGPQQLGGVTPTLPGYPGVNALPPGGAPNVGAPSSSPASSAAGASSTPPALTGAPNYLTMGTPAQNAYAQQNAANQTAANPSLAAQFRTTPTAPAPGVDPFASLRPGGVGAPSLPTAAITPQAESFNTPNGPVPLASAQAPGTLSLNGGQMAVGQTYSAPINLPPQTTQFPSSITGYERLANGDVIEHGTQTVQRPDHLGGGTYQQSYGQGGVIPEKVVGVGQDSGQTYEFGEKGTEAVMSNDMLQKLMAVAGKVDFHQKGSDGKSSRITMTLNGPPKLDMPKKSDMPMMGKTNSYAAGGTIGYSGGKNDYNPQVFNPPSLSGIVGQGFNTPGIPLPPQVNMLTGGGTSLIPSAQTLSHALPSEVGAYSGFLTDEAGVQPNDVFALAKRLAPTATGVRTPSYGN